MKHHTELQTNQRKTIVPAFTPVKNGSMVQVESLTKTYDRKSVVENVSFQVAEGEIFALLGKSGCGKTTTLKMINRLVEPTAGEVIINGLRTSQQDPIYLRRHIGYVVQENGLFPHYTVKENVAVVPELLGHSKAEIDSRVLDVLTQVGLPPERFIERYPHELSGGEQQRVAIARAIAARPPLLLMDEPFSALDPITRRDVRANFYRLSREFGITVILVTHDVAEAIDIADHICLMDEGHILRQGEGKDFLFGEENGLIASFFHGARFETELKVITIADLLPTLTLDKSEGEVMGEIALSDRLYTVFDSAYGNEELLLNLQDENGTVLGATTLSSLINAFFALKQAGSS